MNVFGLVDCSSFFLDEVFTHYSGKKEEKRNKKLLSSFNT